MTEKSDELIEGTVEISERLGSARFEFEIGPTCYWRWAYLRVPVRPLA